MTYPGTHDRDEVGPVNWILHREWVLAREDHPLSVRRAETTKIALKDLEAPSHHLRWAVGVAAGALLAAGAFVASALGDTSEDANGASPVPEHVFTSLEQRGSVTEPLTETPAPAPVNEPPPQETAPAPPQPQADAVAAQDPIAGGGENQHAAPSANTPAPAPAPAPTQNQQWGSDGQWGSGTQRDYGSQWGSGSQWGYNQWGTQQWSPVSGFGAPTQSSYAAATSTPTGPAMSMLDPFCHTMGR